MNYSPAPTKLERNPDTELLAAHLQDAYIEEMARWSGTGKGDDARESAWYRVAERAKELRA